MESEIVNTTKINIILSGLVCMIISIVSFILGLSFGFEATLIMTPIAATLFILSINYIYEQIVDLNKQTEIFKIDELGVGYPARNWSKK